MIKLLLVNIKLKSFIRQTKMCNNEHSNMEAFKLKESKFGNVSALHNTHVASLFLLHFINGYFNQLSVIN